MERRDSGKLEELDGRTDLEVSYGEDALQHEEHGPFDGTHR